MARLQCIQQLLVSTAFRELRMLLIIQRGAVCDKCGEVFTDTSKLVAHHKIEVTADNINDPRITLNPDNIGILCMRCHNAESNRFITKSHDIYIVYGAPLSGKSTAVMHMMRRGDIVVDIDRLWQAVSLCPAYDKPNNLKYNIFAVHGLLIDNIKTRYGKFNDAYIIGGYPNKFERERLADEVNAKLIYCDTTKEECIKRLYADSDRRNVRAEWTGYINAWFDKYTE